MLKKIKVFFLGFDLEGYLACGIPAIPGNLFTLTLKKCVNKQQIMDRRFIRVSFEACFFKKYWILFFYAHCDSDRICLKFYSRHNGNTSFNKVVKDCNTWLVFVFGVLLEVSIYFIINIFLSMIRK